jgi:transposase
LAWLLPGSSEIRSKNFGRLIHISDFILETTGCLKLTPDQYLFSQHKNGKKTESDDAATLIFPGAKGDKWWDMEQLCHQVAQKAIPIFETLHPGLQAVFVFDCSSAYGAYAKSALRVESMNLIPGGKQSLLCNTVIPCDDPHIPEHLCGQPQSLVYDLSHPIHPGKAKGVRAVLEERGLWSYYTQKSRQAGQPALNFHCKQCIESAARKDLINQSQRLIREAKANGYFMSQEKSLEEIFSENSDGGDVNQIAGQLNNPENNCQNNHEMCCWSKILLLQSDFLNERPLLQSIIEDAGHICLFLPKFHCELNPIELFWSYIKTGMQPASPRFLNLYLTIFLHQSLSQGSTQAQNLCRL